MMMTNNTHKKKKLFFFIYIFRYGDPIIQTIDDLEAFHNDPKSIVKNLTDRIAKGVERSTINSPDW